MARRSSGAWIAATVLLIAGGCACADGGPKVGARLPTVTLPDLTGRPVALGALQDRVLVLNFWAFWCDTWQAQWPQLRELATKQTELSFRLIAISVDGSWTDLFQREPDRGPVPFSVLLDAKRTLSGTLGVRRVPTVVILNRHRKVSYAHEAYPGNLKVLEAIRKAAGE